MLIAAIVFTHVFSHWEYKEDLDLEDILDEKSLLSGEEFQHARMAMRSGNSGGDWDNMSIHGKRGDVNSGGSGGSVSGGSSSGGSGGSGGEARNFTSPVKSNRSRITSRDSWTVESDLTGSLQVIRTTTM
jgi:uncharacterized membrane protein YgcG